MSGFATPPLASSPEPTSAADAALAHAGGTAVVKIHADLAGSLLHFVDGINEAQLLTSVTTGYTAAGFSGALRQVEADASLILDDEDAAKIVKGVIFAYLLVAPFVPFLPK